MTFVGLKKREDQGIDLSTWVNNAGDEAVALVEDGGSDRIVGWVVEWRLGNFLFSSYS